MRQLKKIFYCLFFITTACMGHVCAQAWADSLVQVHGLIQEDSAVMLNVRSIIINGNKKTKQYIIYREIQFKQGDSIKTTDLKRALIRARQQVYNTSLFDKVKIDAYITGENSVVITVSIKERWYVYPFPLFQFVDRNFNEWIKLHNGDLNRVNYGAKFTHFNLTGRRDRLSISLINGYTRNISFAYTQSYSNKALTEGFGVAAAYLQNRQIAFKTDHDNKLLFFQADSVAKNGGSFIRNAFITNASYTIRKGFFKKQTITLSYSNLKVADSILFYNPHYFNSSNTHQSFIDLSYVYQYINVNNVSYPLKGAAYFISASKRGFGLNGNINMLQAEAGYSRFIPLGKKWFADFQLNGKIKLPFEQAYINQRGLGYGEVYLRGLEYYVIDGVATALAKTTLKKKILTFNIPLPFKWKAVSTIPFTFYAKTFGDVGYAYNKNGYRAYLNNRLLYTGGFGIDIVTLYDISFRIEYSFNQLNENGLFLHSQGGF